MELDYLSVAVFTLVGAAFVILNVSVVSRLLRPHRREGVKAETYECGEEAVGSAWVRFDIRFYTAALVFIVFDVEIAFLYPWAVVFNRLAGLGQQAVPFAGRAFVLVEMLVFIIILVVGFVYLWAKGDLDWIKSVGTQRHD